MGPTSRSLSEREQQFEEVIAAYLEKVEAGGPADLQALLARNPDLADEITGFFSHQEQLAHLAGPLRELAAATSGQGHDRPEDGERHLDGQLGDYRLLREVGRGGMGIVYEAEQISLGGRVALKVLPFAATMDARHLQRFHNEARAAASLDHAHIVKVHAVGQERGVHYYAMQFIDGQTLAALIAQQRGGNVDQPTIAYRASAAADTAPIAVAPTERAPHDRAYFRRAAEWGIQAAEALEHAHQLGVVHRDVKPANLMIDGRGKLCVADFGLARTAADAGLTMSGDLIGTLRYMSPEQALAKRMVIDHRTDVYSLGATLYELLVLRPVFDGADRQELLRQIAFEEPRPPRRVNKAIPEELETIVLKALEKNPAERYATAQELALDLRRWLEDRPILAWRTSWRRLATKWARRHPTMVWAAVIILAVTVPVLAASTAWAWHMNGLTTAAKQQADDNAQKARDRATEAERQRTRADNNLQQGIEEISRLVMAALDDPRTGRPPSLEEVRKAQAEHSFAFYQRLLQENRTDPAGRLQAGLSYRGLLHHYDVNGDGPKTAEAYRQAVAVFKQLKADFPAEARYQEELKKTHTSMRKLIRYLHNVKTGRESARGHKETAKCWQQVATLSEALTIEQPDDPNDWMILGKAFYWMGRELWLAGQMKEAEESISKALPVFAKLEGDTRNGPEMAWREAAFAYLWRADLRAEAGRLPEAEADYRQALALCEKLAKADEFWSDLQRYPSASAQQALGNLLWDRNRQEEAAAAFRRAEKTWQQILDSRESKDFTLYSTMARFYATCPDKQFRKPARAVELAKQAVENAARSLRDVGDCYKTLGIAQYRAGDWKAARAALEKSMEFRKSGDSFDWFFLAMAHRQLGDKEEARKWYDKAVQWMDQNKPKDAELVRFRAEAAELLAINEK